MKVVIFLLITFTVVALGASNGTTGVCSQHQSCESCLEPTTSCKWCPPILNNSSSNNSTSTNSTSNTSSYVCSSSCNATSSSDRPIITDTELCPSRYPNCTEQTECFTCMSSNTDSTYYCQWCPSSKKCFYPYEAKCDEDLVIAGVGLGGAKCPELRKFSALAAFLPLGVFVVIIMPIFVLALNAQRSNWRDRQSSRRLLCCGVNFILAGGAFVAITIGTAYAIIVSAYGKGSVGAGGAYAAVAFCSICFILSIIALTCGSCYVSVYIERKPRTQCHKCGKVNGLQDHCSNCGALIGKARDHMNKHELQESLPWDFSSNKRPGWESRDGFRVLKFVDGGQVLDNNMHRNFSLLWNECFHGNNLTPLEVYAVDNSGLRQTFDQKLVRIHEKMENEPDIYARTDWIEDHHRSRIMENLSDQAHQYDHNTKISPPVIPMIMGVDDPDQVWRLCKHGFSNLTTIEQGYYGNGMYFSSSAEYATNLYTRLENRVVVVSWVTPGNSYPVIENPNIPRESYIGRNIKQGYDSHYALVDGTGLPLSKSKVVAFDDDNLDLSTLYDELVISSEDQILPCYVVFLGRGRSATLFKAKVDVNPSALNEMQRAREEDQTAERARTQSFQIDRQKRLADPSLPMPPTIPLMKVGEVVQQNQGRKLPGRPPIKNASTARGPNNQSSDNLSGSRPAPMRRPAVTPPTNDIPLVFHTTPRATIEDEEKGFQDTDE